MKTIARVLIVILVVVTLIPVVASAIENAKTEPWMLYINYISPEGKLVCEKYEAEKLFGRKTEICCKSGTGFTVEAYRNEKKGYYLTEYSVVTHGNHYWNANVWSDYGSHLSNVYMYGKADDGYVTFYNMNIGTDEEPRWVFFQIETVCEI